MLYIIVIVYTMTNYKNTHITIKKTIIVYTIGSSHQIDDLSKHRISKFYYY